jgi:ribosomal protein L14E/L6E/L27E
MAEFKVGQVVVLKRDGRKRDLTAKILEIVDEGGIAFYRIDKQNCVSGSMIRALTEEEKGNG